MRQNLHLVANGVLYFFAGFATDESFVNFDNAAANTEVNAAIITHGLADTARHKPSGFQGYAKGAVQFIAAEAFLAGAHQINGLQPRQRPRTASSHISVRQSRLSCCRFRGHLVKLA